MNEQWLTWATEIQAIAQTGLAYATDVFDRERYTRLREISAEILASYAAGPGGRGARRGPSGGATWCAGRPRRMCWRCERSPSANG